MKPRIVITGDSVHVLSVAQAIANSGIGDECEIIYLTESSVEKTRIDNTIALQQFESNSSEIISNFCNKEMLAYPEEIGCDIDEIRQGIADFHAWLDHRCRQILNFARGQVRRHLFIFQPCWSSRRWKSLT